MYFPMEKKITSGIINGHISRLLFNVAEILQFLMKNIVKITSQKHSSSTT